MVRLSGLSASDKCILLLNLLTIFLSLVILAMGIMINNRVQCEGFLATWLIVIGIILLIISLAGFIGASGVPALLWLYLVFMFFLILVAVGFSIFAFLVTNKGAGEFLSGKGYSKEYGLGDYSHWLQNRVNNTGNWDKIKSCLIDSQICTDFNRMFSKNTTFENLQKEPFNALKWGCCKPPMSCGFRYRSPSNWTEEEGVYKNPDCKAWDNDKSVLCYNCQSCKAGLLDNIRTSWRDLAFYNAAALVLLIFVYSIALCAFQNLTY